MKCLSFPAWIAAVAVAFAAGCAAGVSAGEQVRHVSGERLIPAPNTTQRRIEVPALAHILRGLYFLASDRPSAAVPHLRLALVYDSNSPYMHEQLTRAWARSGQSERAKVVLERGLSLNPEDGPLSALAGQIALRNLDSATAYPLLKQALTSDVIGLDVFMAWADALLWQRPIGEARAESRALAKRRAEDPDLLYALAVRFEEHGFHEDALDYFKRAREQRPGFRFAALGAVRVLMGLGQWGQAADQLIPLLASYPDSLDVYARVAALMRRAERGDAESYWQEAIRLAEGDPDAVGYLAASLVQAGRLDDAVALLEDNQQTAATHGPTTLLLAQIDRQAGSPAACVKRLSQSRWILAPVVELRARCLAEAGQAAAAVDAWIQAAELGGDREQAVQEGAQYFARMFPLGRAKKWLGRLRERLDVPAGTAAARLAQATVLDHHGQWEKALAHVEEALKADRSRLDVRLRRADLLARGGRMEASLKILRDLVREEPNDPVRLNALGFTLTDANLHLREAEVWIRRAYRMVEDEGFVVDSLGWWLFRNGRTEEAERMLQRAVLLSPRDPEILLHLGDVLRAMGKTPGARKRYEEALACFPSRSIERILRNRLRAVGGRS